MVTLCAAPEPECLAAVDGEVLRTGATDDGAPYTIILNPDQQGSAELSDSDAQYWDSVQPTHEPDWLEE